MYFIKDFLLFFICILPPRYNWNIVESGVKHHDPNPDILIYFIFNVKAEYFVNPVPV
jgi:hypothetical protein